jgi:hypothetical protein
MLGDTLGHLTPENRRLLESRREFDINRQIEAVKLWPFLRPCDVRVLMVVDGLDYSEGDFGLATFVRALLSIPGHYVRLRITLAHIGNASGPQMMDSETRIVNRFANFRFDDPTHFAVSMYDEVFLFGIASTFGGRGTASNGQPYPDTQLAEPELRVLTQFMNNGGGLFAAGDHGSLGRFLSHAVPRARNMRLWQSTSAQNELDQVSMTGSRRNDTNRLGDGSSEFNDQSDDIPQPVQPRIYSRRTGFFRFTFPHPLLCGPKGVIRVMPDHPHEGECREPRDIDLTLNFGGDLGPEYPNGPPVGARPLPEIISTNTVLSGVTSGGKAATVAQSFGGICAYDGHRAKIGRVVTDATWHHFVNINLVGELGLDPLDPKSLGFLATPAGQVHFENIKSYYRNLAVWLAPPERIRCMNTRLAWSLLWSDRVMEAVLSTPDVRIADLHPRILYIIGKHARDVLGRFAGQCQSVGLILDLFFERALPQLIPDIDPWLPDLPRPDNDFDDVRWFDGSPVLDMAFGGALVALREAIPQPDEQSIRELDSDKLQEIMLGGARVGIERALNSAAASMKLAARYTDAVRSAAANPDGNRP